MADECRAEKRCKRHDAFAAFTAEAKSRSRLKVFFSISDFPDSFFALRRLPLTVETNKKNRDKRECKNEPEPLASFAFGTQISSGGAEQVLPFNSSLSKKN